MEILTVDGKIDEKRSKLVFFRGEIHFSLIYFQNQNADFFTQILHSKLFKKIFRRIFVFHFYFITFLREI